jgi:serine/threonine-protein kinase
MTQTAAVVGTAQYLSPEQARGENVDSRSDVYSAGCLLYELLTGRPPFVGESPVSVAYQHVREQAPVPSALDPELSPQVDAIVMKALAKKVTERYPSAAAMKADIDRHLAGQRIQAPPAVAVPETATTVMHTPPPPPTDRTAEHRAAEPEDHRRRNGPLVLLALLLLALIALAIFLGPKLLKGAADTVDVPNLSGMTQQQAETALSDKGLSVGEVTQVTSRDVPKGQVVSQDPSAGTAVDPDKEGSVNLQVSAGKPNVQIPDLIGDNKDAAAQSLRQLNLTPVLKERKSDETAGNVIALKPGVGEEVAEGTKVTVFYASGPQKVPDVVGLTEDQAKKLLGDAGFEVSSLPDDASTEPKGTVTRQSPEKGQPLNQGSTVTILVSTYDPATLPPSPPVTPTDSATPLP